MTVLDMRPACFISVWLGLLASRPAYAHYCSNGLEGLESQNQCCVLDCGTCGGVGCRTRAEAVDLTADDCCVTSIRQNNILCSDSGAAPCTVDDSACPNGASVCNDPHIQGLRGQHIEWSGNDGEWYALVKDQEDELQINVRPTAPLPDTFPERQYVTGVAVLASGHSLIIEVRDPHTTHTDGCQTETDPCLAQGGLRIIVDGHEMGSLQSPVVDHLVAGDIELSSANLPLECREFGGSKTWAHGGREARIGKRATSAPTFADWILEFNHVVAPDWCTKVIMEHGLDGVQSDQAVFRIVTTTAVIRFSVGINHRGGGKMNRFGRMLPELDFWQTSVGVAGLSPDHKRLSGLLGETARPVFDADGTEVVDGPGAIPAAVEDFRVSSAVGTNFPFEDSPQH